MRWFVRRDRDLDAFAEAMRPELRGLPAPAASAALRDRILADRAAGMRIILPDGGSIARPLRRYSIAAAVMIAALLALPIYRAATDARDEPAATLFSFFGGVARAEQRVNSKPRLPSAIAVHPERVRARRLEYERVWNDSLGRVVKRASSTLSLSADTAAAAAAWRVVAMEHDSAGGPGVTKAETLLVRQRDLHLLTRSVHVRPYRRWPGINIEQQLIGDSVRGRMTLDSTPGMRRIERRLPPAYRPFVADVFAPVYFAAVPLDSTWHGSLTMLGWAVVPNDVLYPIELRVAGEERVRVPAGTFDCWRIAVRYAGGAIDFWVRKSDGVGVRTAERDARLGGARTVTLVREAGM